MGDKTTSKTRRDLALLHVNALGDIFVGRTGQSDSSSRRRGVVSFDVAANVPSGATITSAKLRLYLNRTDDNASLTISIYTVDASWGEGTSYYDGGLGAASTTNDATWVHRFYNTSSWTSTGGDFNSTASASTGVGTTYQYYEWGSNGSTVADVQDWLDTPGTNYGWLAKSDESTSHRTRRFTSGEGDSLELPELVISYTTNGFAPEHFWARAADGEDVSGDGIPDTVWRNLQTGELLLQLNGRTRVPLGAVAPSSVTLGVRDLGAGPALVVLDRSTGNVTAVPLGNARARPTSLVHGSLGLRLVRFADVDADGRDDLVVRDDAAAQLYAAGSLFAGGGTVLKGALLPSGHAPGGI